MKDKKYSCLIVGCGNMGCLNDAPGSGNEHKTISYAKALKDNGNFEVFYYDKDRSKIEKAIEIWGGNYDSEDYYDVVIIATPDDTHWTELTNIVKYDDKYPKLVICEKPLCETVEEAKDIINRYEQAGIPILLDMTRNFIPCLRELTKDHGKPLYGYCMFNRGALHTAVHAVGFFEMLGLKNYKLQEIKNLDYRVWSLNVCFEDGFHFKEERTKDMDVPEYYDYHTKYVVQNAFEYLEEGKPLLCDMYLGLKTLEVIETTML